MDFSQVDKLVLKRNACLMQSREPYYRAISRFLKKYEEEFTVRYTFESTAIEGNTCTYNETRKILAGIYQVSGAERQREIYEIHNHANTFAFAKEKLRKGELLDEKMIREFHRRLVENIIPGGIYRNENVGVSGSRFEFPDWKEVPFLMHDFGVELQQKAAVCGLPEAMHPIELAAWAHEEFVSIHPYRDGNGRTARMLSNYILMQHGYLPISVPVDKVNTQRYYEILEKFHTDHNIEPLAAFFGELEKGELERVIEIEQMPLKVNSIIPE